MPIEAWLVSKYIYGITVNMNTIGHVFNHKASGFVCHHPMKIRWLHACNAFAYNGKLVERAFYLFKGGKIAADPQGKLVGGNVNFAFNRGLLVCSKACKQ